MASNGSTPEEEKRQQQLVSKAHGPNTLNAGCVPAGGLREQLQAQAA
jgi:hypothetical protein